MTYEQAVEQARQGKKIRHPGMGKGWTIGRVDGSEKLYCLNPHTMSNYAFTPSRDDVIRSDWSTSQ